MWVITKHIVSTDDKTEKIYCELRLDFPTSRWNKNEKRPVLNLYYYDYKVESGWWINPVKWYARDPYKTCRIWTNYFQSQPELGMYASSGKDGRVNYKDFTIEYCQMEAIKVFTERLENILKQIKR